MRGGGPGERLRILALALRSGEGVVKGCRRGVKRPDLGKRPTTSAIQSPQVCGRSTKLRLFDLQTAHTWSLHYAAIPL